MSNVYVIGVSEEDKKENDRERKIFEEIMAKIFLKFDEMHTFTDPETQGTSNRINLKKTVPMHIIF